MSGVFEKTYMAAWKSPGPETGSVPRSLAVVRGAVVIFLPCSVIFVPVVCFRIEGIAVRWSWCREPHRKPSAAALQRRSICV